MSVHALWKRQVTTALQRSATHPTTTPLPRHSPRPKPQPRARRFRSSDAKPPPDPTSQAQAQTQRISRIRTRATRFLPQRLQTSLRNLRSAPLSHIGAFLLLHEVTAILPIFGLTYAFHELDWVPTSWVLGPWAAWAEDGLRKYVPYFRRKRWFGLHEAAGDDNGDGRGRADGEEALESELRERTEREGRKKSWFARLFGKRNGDAVAEDALPADSSQADLGGARGEKAAAVWHKVKKAATVDNTEKGYKIGVQIAAAYAITKLLLVPRIALSLWLTPWLARGLIGLRQTIRRKRS